MGFALFIHAAQYAASRYCALRPYGDLVRRKVNGINLGLARLVRGFNPAEPVLRFRLHGFCSFYSFGAICGVPLLHLTALVKDLALRLKPIVERAPELAAFSFPPEVGIFPNLLLQFFCEFK